MKLQNATALVTGANRGIGRAFVKGLLDGGVQKVYATARDRNSLAAITALDPLRVIPLQVDVTDLSLVSQLAEQAPNVNLKMVQKPYNAMSRVFYLYSNKPVLKCSVMGVWKHWWVAIASIWLRSWSSQARQR